MNGLRNCCCAAAGVLGAAIFFVQHAAAQHVVQLPEYHVTSVQTTVSVPDSGGAYLGGVNSAAAGSVNQGLPGLGVGPFGNRAMSGTSAGGGMWVGAKIHDLQAMDAAILGQTGSAQRPLVLAPEILNQSGSVADLKAKGAADDAARQQEAADNLAHAKQLLAEGKPGVAKIYFQLAAKRATGDVQQQAMAGLQSLNLPKAALTVSSQSTPR